jgi:Beta-propeller domains of methanol dehydrogenase type
MRLPAVVRASLTARFVQAPHHAARTLGSAFFFVQCQHRHGLDSKGNCLTGKYQARPTVAFRKFNQLLQSDELVIVRKTAATHGRYGIGLPRKRHGCRVTHPRGNLRTQMLLNSRARRFSHSHTREKIVTRLIASIAMLAAAASLTGCVVAPGYDYAYAQPYYPYYPGYGYAYGPAYGPVYGTVGFWGGSCCYYHGGGGYWHGGGWHGGGWHGGGWHGGGSGGGSHGGGSSWSSGGGQGGHGH